MSESVQLADAVTCPDLQGRSAQLNQFGRGWWQQRVPRQTLAFALQISMLSRLRHRCRSLMTATTHESRPQPTPSATQLTFEVQRLHRGVHLQRLRQFLRAFDTDEVP